MLFWKAFGGHLLKTKKPMANNISIFWRYEVSKKMPYREFAVK